MPRPEELKYYLKGLWLLVLHDRQGLDYLDISDRGLMRSFWAIVWCLPSIAISWAWWGREFIETGADPSALGATFFMRMAMIEAANWIFPLILAGFFVLLLGASQFFPAIVVISNWLSVPFSYVYAVLVATSLLVPGFRGMAALLSILLMMTLILSLTRILRLITGAKPLVITALVMVMLVPPLFLSDMMERFLGINAF